LSHSANHFLWWVFWHRVPETICLGWLRTVILLISASWVARLQVWATDTRLLFIFRWFIVCWFIVLASWKILKKTSPLPCLFLLLSGAQM
jgi:hypothetical protein